MVDTRSALLLDVIFCKIVQEKSCKKMAVLYYRDSENIECTSARGVQAKNRE